MKIKTEVIAADKLSEALADIYEEGGDVKFILPHSLDCGSTGNFVVPPFVVNKYRILYQEAEDNSG